MGESLSVIMTSNAALVSMGESLSVIMINNAALESMEDRQTIVVNTTKEAELS